MAFSRAPKRYLALLCLCLLAVAFLPALPQQHNHDRSYSSPILLHGQRENRTAPAHAQHAFLHLIVPATSSNQDLCKLLLSTAALDYPSPVFINWGQKTPVEGEYAAHLAKVRGILNYLENLQSREHDLVLIIDGFDVTFQLGPDVLIGRYFEVVRRGNRHLKHKFGAKTVEQLGLYNSVVFGSDKICWPEDPARAACWAVPDSPLERYAFGPDTDSGFHRHLNRPRWLNSGTIMGPVADVREVFKATLRRIEEHHTIDSDQMYFADVWGRQEYARTLLLNDTLGGTSRTMWIPEGYAMQGHRDEVRLDVPMLHPDLDKETAVELHMTIDYESTLFQTMAHYWPYLAWVNYGNSEDPNARFKLPSDIQPSRLLPADSIPQPGGMTRNDLTLATNTVTGQIPTLLHFTPPKFLRMLWFGKNWFFPYGRSTLNTSSASSEASPIVKTAGHVWWRYEDERLEEVSQHARVGGGFSDGGIWLSWKRMCASHEDAVFHNKLEEGEETPPSLHDQFPLEYKLQKFREDWKVSL